MRESTVAATLFIDVAGFLERRGVDRGSMFEALGIDEGVLAEPNARLPGSWMERLLHVGEQFTGDHDLGLRTAEVYNPGALHILGYVLLSCRSAGEALERLARYASLLNDGLRVTVAEEGAFTYCRLAAVETLDNFLVRAPRQVMEAMACGTVTSIRRLTPAMVGPVSISFRHAVPKSTAEHERIFGQPVLFSQPENVFIFRTRDLRGGLVSANPALLEVFEARAKLALEHLAERGTVSQRVLAVLTRRMTGTVPSVGEVAAELAMSERTVQRELLGENTTFRRLVDDVRRQTAIQHLAQPGASATEVAFLLGFSEPSAFTRAFRRWTGSAPSEYRPG